MALSRRKLLFLGVCRMSSATSPRPACLFLRKRRRKKNGFISYFVSVQQGGLRRTSCINFNFSQVEIVGEWVAEGFVSCPSVIAQNIRNILAVKFKKRNCKAVKLNAPRIIKAAIYSGALIGRIHVN